MPEIATGLHVMRHIRLQPAADEDAFFRSQPHHLRTTCKVVGVCFPTIIGKQDRQG